jgi:branched-chain amino acid transport system ATP-binding protein
MAEQTSLLELREVVVAFGGLRAVDGVSMTVGRGTLVGLIGPNGAGKSTIVDAVTGFVPIEEGSIRFDGDDVTRVPAHRRARRGLARTFQSLELFEDLTVAENVRVPATVGYAGRHPLAYRAAAKDRDRSASTVLDQLGLGEVANDLPGLLSQADRRGLALARALAVRPKLLLLDEPAAGLDASGTQALGARLRAIVDRGTAMLLVDHDMSLVLGICDYVYVVDTGRLIAEGAPAEIRRDPAVLRSYLGEVPPSELADTAMGGDG